jgi:serine/threonine-protein kinase RsbW
VASGQRAIRSTTCAGPGPAVPGRGQRGPLALRDGLTIDASSHLAWIEGIEQLAVCTACEAGLDADSGFFLGVAVREAIVNAIRHGHRFDKDYRVRVSIRVTSDRVMVVTVSDRGPGFDPSAVPDPLAPDNLTRPGGRGLLFMRRFTDRVSFLFPSGGGSIVRLEKDLPSRPAA